MAIANITNNILTDSGVATSALQIALNGTGFVKISGTTISYDNSTYALDSAVVKLTGTQTVGGAKTFSTYSKFDGGVILKNNVSASLAGYVGLSAYSASGNKGINIDFDTYSASFYFSGILPYQYTFPAATGTLALTSDLSSYLPLTGGTLTGDLSIAYTSANLRLFLNNTTATTGRSWYFNSYSNGNLYVGNTTAGDIFNFSSTGAATFSSSVNLGSIANSGDIALLNIKQASTAYNNGIYIERGGERNGYFMYIGGAVDSLTFRRNYFGTQSDVMSLTRDGNVGIGTTGPNAKLTVWTPSTTGMQTALRLNNPFGFANQNTGAKIVFSQDRSAAEDLPMGEMGVGQEAGGTSAYGYMFFSTLNSTMGERMRITSGGNVEIASGSIKTGTPSGGTAKPWKLGQDTSTLYSATRTIQVEIDGGTYYLLAVKSTDL